MADVDEQDTSTEKGEDEQDTSTSKDEANKDQPHQPDPEGGPRTGDTAPAKVHAALRKANKEAEKLRLKLKEYEDRDKTEQQKAADRAVAAEQAAAAAAQRLLRAEIKAAAAGKLTDPGDAHRFLDLEVLVDDDGTPDEAKIAAAIGELVKSKPYLAAKSPDPGDGDQGPRGGGSGGGDEDKTTEDFVSQFSRNKRT